jgi:hypothetical protein
LALPPTPSGVIRVRLIHEQPNADHVGTHHDLAYSGSAPSSANLVSIANEVVSVYTTHLQSFLNASALLATVECVDLANPSTPSGVTSPALAGTRSGTAVPNNIAAGMVFEVARRYRGSRPKAFLPFFSDSDMSGTISWLTSSVTALSTAWGAYTSGLFGYTAGGCTIGAPVGVSYYSGKIANPNPNSRSRFIPSPRAVPLVQTVTSQACQTRFYSQRRRLTAA